MSNRNNGYSRHMIYTETEFNCICNGLSWFAENDENEARRSRAERTLKHIMNWVYLHNDESPTDHIARYGEPIIHTVVNWDEYSLADTMLDIYDDGLDAGFGHEDYFAKALEKVEEYRKKREAEWECVKQAIRKYVAEHSDQKIVKKRVAQALGLGYSRCLAAFREIEDEDAAINHNRT